MSARELSDKYYGKITFWGGGCDIQSILPSGTPSQVGKHVKEQLHTWGNRGGFVFQQVHNIMADISPENICAMFNALK